jgi:hypothetical protein
LKIFVCSAILLFQISVAQAQTFNPGLPTNAAPAPAAPAPAAANNANGAAGSSMLTGVLMAATSAGMGTYLMIQAHAIQPSTPASQMEMMMGASLVAGGATDALQAKGYGNTGDQIAAGDPSLGTGGTGTPLDPFMQGLLNTANQIAADEGTTVPALADQAAAAGDDGGGGGGGGGLGSFASHLSPSTLEGMKKAGQDAAAHYRVSAVATEGGGGKQKGDTAFDINDILNGLKDRGAASVAGLQKSLNGQPIGVAQDNIFHMVSSRYQAKIALRMFLPIQK